MNTQLRLKFYYDYILGQVYAEGDSPFHKSITEDVITRFIEPLQLHKKSAILDLGCGPGYFLDAMKSRGFDNLVGLSLSAEDVATCRSNGHNVRKADINFLSDPDESIDMLFCRHSIEHSPFPYITLLEYNRVLRPGGRLYIEVPAPDCERKHETNRNHYSIMGKTMWLSLLQRSGFDIEWHEITFPVKFNETGEIFEEHYYIFMCERKRPVDVK